MNSLMYSKNYNTDFCEEFVNELDIYVFMYLNSKEILWFRIISAAVVAQ